MKNYVVAGAIVIVVAIILGYFLLAAQPKEATRIENDWGDVKSQTNGVLENGTWGTRIYIEFEDGSEMPLYFILQPTMSFEIGKNLGVYYSGKKVNKVYYILEGRALGEAEGNVEVKFNSFGIKSTSTVDGKELKTTTKPIGMVSYQLPINSEWVEVKRFGFSLSDLFGNYHLLSTYSGKTVTVKFEPVGNISYKAPSDATYHPSSLPKPVIVDFKFIAPGQVEVSFKAGVGS